MRNVECRVWSVECAVGQVWRVQCSVWGVECKV